MQDADLTPSIDSLPFDLDDFNPDEDVITSELVKPAEAAADRSVARRACLQILYEVDTTDHALRSVLETHLSERPDAFEVRQIIRRIVEGVMANCEPIDAILQEFAPDWPIHQVAVVDRNILRIAVFEYLLQTRITPVPVIINEAVHLAQLFGAENAPGFVHGVLGAITAEENHDLRFTGDEVDSV